MTVAVCWEYMSKSKSYLNPTLFENGDFSDLLHVLSQHGADIVTGP